MAMTTSPVAVPLPIAFAAQMMLRQAKRRDGAEKLGQMTENFGEPAR
jgi:hypothetical protein